MSEQPPRPVSLFALLSVCVGLGLFAIVLRYFYDEPARLQPYNVAGEKMPEDQQWKATPEGRMAHLEKWRAEQAKQAAGVEWIDRGKGVVRLPLDQAMKLTAEEMKTRAKR